jgi:hypothetical protein
MSVRPLLGHAIHVCDTGAVASCAAGPVYVGPNSIWRGGLGRQTTWERGFESRGLRKQTAFLHSWRCSAPAASLRPSVLLAAALSLSVVVRVEGGGLR